MSIKLFGQSQILKKDETLLVVREGTNIPGNVVYVDGKPIKRNGVRFPIVANVQPFGAKDLLLVPEGDRYRQIFWIYFENKCVKSEEGIEIDAADLVKDNDQVVRNGKYYQAQGVESWGSYSRARIMSVDVGPNAPRNARGAQ
jgi:hypothetical protein